MKKEFGKCAYVLEKVNTHYINCSKPDIQVRTFVSNFESIFISHLQSGNRAVGTEEQGVVAPLDCDQNISKNLYLQKLNRVLPAHLYFQTFLRPCFLKRSPSILKGKENSISSFIHRQKRKLFNTFLRKSCSLREYLVKCTM